MITNSATPKFQRAERRRVKVKIALEAPSGGGKTFSALLLAKGLGGKIAVLDTENDSASLYANDPRMPEFDSLCIGAPFHTDKYVKAIELAIAGDYNVLIIDSATHQWKGEGGILDRMDKEKLAKPTLNGFTLWAKYTPEHNKFISAITQSPIHIIVTMRSKSEYVLGEGQNGKTQPKKVGMAAEQRDQFEFEFTTVFSLNQEHYFTVSKDRTGLFDNRNEKIGPEHGQELLKWLEGATADALPPPPVIADTSGAVDPNAISEPQRRRLYALANKSGIPDVEVTAILGEYGFESSKSITKECYEEICKRVEGWKAPPAEATTPAAGVSA